MSLSCTSYTSLIQDGQVTTATDFLKCCLHGFGVMINFRDEPITSELPASIPGDDWHARQLAEAEKKLEKCLAMTDSEWCAELHAAISEEEESLAKYQKECDEFTAKLNAIKEKVESWQCDPKYAEVKKFALEQIKVSMPDPLTWMYESLADLKNQTLEDFKKVHIDGAKKDVEYHQKELARDEQLHKERNEFLSGFKQDLEKLEGK